MIPKVKTWRVSCDGICEWFIVQAPTKALANDQLRALDALGLPWLRAATYDGDTPHDERAWVRQHGNYVLSNPDLLHHSLLPGHTAWASYLRRLKVVVIDEEFGIRVTEIVSPEDRLRGLG